MALSNSPFQRIKKPLASDMNVVPYIDVMLVLLVIFMVTAPMLTTGLTVDLPKAETSALSVAQLKLGRSADWPFVTPAVSAMSFSAE